MYAKISEFTWPQLLGDCVDKWHLKWIHREFEKEIRIWVQEVKCMKEVQA